MEIEYIPEIITIAGQKYAKVLIEIVPCPICKNMMWDREEPFSNYFKLEIIKQLKRAEIRLESDFDIREGSVCEVCKKEDKANFRCALCEKEYRSSEIKEDFGADWGKEYLCKNCYETASAKQWLEKVEYLNESHRYDFE